MAKVKVLREHSNAHGMPRAEFVKAKDSEYEHPHPEQDVADGLVQVVDAPADEPGAEAGAGGRKRGGDGGAV